MHGGVLYYRKWAGIFTARRGDVRGVQAAGDAAGLGEAELSILEVIGEGNGSLGHGADHGKGGKDQNREGACVHGDLEGT